MLLGSPYWLHSERCLDVFPLCLSIAPCVDKCLSQIFSPCIVQVMVDLIMVLVGIGILAVLKYGHATITGIESNEGIQT